jgi:hypothetical protein
LGSFRKKRRGRFLPLVLRGLPKAYAWPATVLVNELDARGFQRPPSDAHHLKFAEQRAMGRKVSDRFTVPICRLHHRELHRRGDERAWWGKQGIDSPSRCGHPLAEDAYPRFSSS